MEQPNVTHDGEAALTTKFWFAVFLTGVAAGLFGDLLMGILKAVEHLAFGYSNGTLEHAVASTAKLRRVTMLMIGSVIGATAWYLIRRYLKNEKSEIDEALWTSDGELSLRRSFLTSLSSIVVIGFGASVGREAAPKLMGGAAGSALSHWFNLSPQQKKLLVACGGGAGLACVYNVPLGGAIFTAEVLYGSFALPVAMPALVTSLVATMTAWLTLPNAPIYTDVPSFRFSGSLETWSVLAGVVIGLLATSYIRVIGFVSHYRARGAKIFWMMPLAFLVVAILSLWYPQLYGNGLDIAHDAFLGTTALGLLFALLALKPFATAITLGSGAAGGVFTPFMATGAVAGGFLGYLWLHVWHGAPIGAFAVVGAAAMIGSAMQAPLTGMVLVMELIHGGFSIMIPMLTATAIATIVVRTVDGYSIYSARLPRHESA